MSEPALCRCGCGQPAPIAPFTDKHKGLVKGQPLRYVAGHQSVERRQTHAVEDRGFTTPCWIWQGSCTRLGYGTCVRDGKNRLAHRWYYEQRYGSVESDLDHLCRQRACVNPEHMEPVTHAENVRRGRRCKITMDDARAIRASHESSYALAGKLGVVPETVRLVRKGRTWKEET